MYFGTEALKADKRLNPALVTESVTIDSVVYNEYLNRKALFEACTDENQKPLLEAQVEVLCEASVKDFIDKVKKLINSFMEWVKKLIKKVKDFFTGAKYKAQQEEIEKLKKELASKNISNINLDKEIKDLKEKLEKTEKSSSDKDATISKKDKEIEAEKHATEFEKGKIKDLINSNSQTRSELENQLDRLEKLKASIADPTPEAFFDARNYLRGDFSPQKLARCAHNVADALGDKYERSSKQSIENWLEEYENYMCILNDKTKERLGKDSDLEGGFVNHSSFVKLVEEDIQEEAEKYRGKDISEIYKRIEISDYASASWLAEILDGYEIFAQNLIKAVEKEFNVSYTQSVGNYSSARLNKNEEPEGRENYDARKEATYANELFKRADAAIKLCKGSVTACGTLINYEAKSLGACKQLMKTIKAAIIV